MEQTKHKRITAKVNLGVGVIAFFAFPFAFSFVSEHPVAVLLDRFFLWVILPPLSISLLSMLGVFDADAPVGRMLSWVQSRILNPVLDISDQQREYRSHNPVVSRAFDWAIDISALVGAFIVLYVALTIGANVMGRYVFDNPLKWALPTTEYSLLYLTFLAAPVVLRREGHVRMSAITERLGSTGRLWFYVIGSFISSAVCGVMAWKALEKTAEESLSGAILLSGIEVQRALVTWVIPYGFILLGLQFLRMCVNAVRLRRYREATEEAGI